MRFKKSDITFYANIDINGTVIKGVLCRAYLPLKVTDKIELYFQPTSEQAERIKHLPFWKFSFEGEVKDYQGNISKKIFSETVYSNKVETTSHSQDLAESYFIGEPSDLKLIHFLGSDSGESKVNGVFWLTPSQMLQPAFVSEHSSNGETKITIARSFEFSPNGETLLKFENNHKEIENETGDTVSFYELVAKFELEFELEEETYDSPKILNLQKNLDDILLISSFAARKKSICLGWSANDSKTIVKNYFRNRVIPKDIERKGGRGEWLIDLSDFPEFMKCVFPSFQEYSDIAAFRRTLNIILPSYEKTIESSFVNLYTALEMIVLHFRKEKDLERIQPNNQFKKFKKNLIKYIEGMELVNGEIVKPKIIDKLPELNRISFRNAYDQFCAFYSVDVSDLWQVVDSSDGIALSQLRNKLVHGENFGDGQNLGLFYAGQHLRWIVERMVLSVLGWDVERSNVRNSYLNTLVAYDRWKEELKHFPSS